MTSSDGNWETYDPSGGGRSPAGRPPEPAGRGLSCTRCDWTPLEPGFVMDSGQAAAGFAQWVPGPMESGLFGGAKLWGKMRFQVDAWHCPRCHHLDLFVGQQSA